MTEKITKLAGIAISTLLLTAHAIAEIPLHQNLSVDGYVAASYRYSSEGYFDTDKYDLDRARLNFNMELAPVKGHIGFVAEGDSDVTLIDAYATYDAGNGLSFTAGRFLTYFGYEAYDIPAMNYITYGNYLNGTFISGFHSGAKVDYATDAFSVGLAVLDSVFGNDGDFDATKGFEAQFTYTGIKGLTLFAGFGYEAAKKSSVFNDMYIANLWAGYDVTEQLNLGAELSYCDEKDVNKGCAWMVTAKYAITPKFSIAGRVGGDVNDEDAVADTLRATICPSYKLSDNLFVRAELSYTEVQDIDDADLFLGAQVVFAF
ncbi:MAG: porin [Opitutaceae bacterium]|jgi:hypothetical protein|nr:porin [Opitutaceae bacterium]